MSIDSGPVAEVADTLRAYATHFSERDWQYTRDRGNLKRLVYDYESDRLRSRVGRAWSALTRRREFGWLSVSRWSLARHMLRPETHLPDGTLNGGTVLTHWEEDGEYIQLVQPTVGALIADWMTAEPDNPYAQAVAAEMTRIQNDYAARLQAGRKSA